MSWPATDRELEIEQELQALRKVADAARAVIMEGSTWKHSRISDSLTDKLAEALSQVPEPST